MKKSFFFLSLTLTMFFYLSAFRQSNTGVIPLKSDVKYGASVTYTAVKDQSSWGCQTSEYDQKPYMISVEGRTDCMWATAKTAITVARRDAKSNVPACYKLADPDGEGQIRTWTCN